MRRSKLSYFSFFICAGFILICTFIFHPWSNPGSGVLNWDVYGYYLYLPAFFYDDPAELNNIDSIQDKYHPTEGFYQAFKAPNGNYVMKYSAGQAIMYLPAFGLAHLYAKFFGYPVDGFSLPYQFAIHFENIIVAFLGLWFLRKILLLWFSDKVVALTLVVLVFASNYLAYTAFAGGFSHNYLFTLYCIVIWLAIRWHQHPSWSLSACLGLLCGLAALTRPTEIISASIPLLWGIANRKDIIERFTLLIAHAPKIILFFLSAFAVGAIQLIYWKIYAGEWLYFSYGEDQTFSWLHPHLYSILFTYKKGWLVYTPVMSLSVIGFVFLWLNYRQLFLMSIIFFCVALYITATWDLWWFGGSFSMRALIQYYPMLSFPLAAALDFFSGRKVLSVLLTLFITFCIWLNLLMTYWAFCSKQYILSGDSMTAKYFWEVFGKTSIDDNDRKFMDTNEELPVALENNLVTIYSNDFESDSGAVDTSFAHSGKMVGLLNKEIQHSPVLIVPIDNHKRSWYRVYVWVYAPQFEGSTGQQSQFLVSLWNNDEKKKEKFFRIYRIIKGGKWEQIFIDINGSTVEEYDRLEIKFWNSNGTLPLFIDDISVGKAEIKEGN